MRQISDVMPVLKDIADDIRVFTKGPLSTISKNINDGIAENRAALKSMVANLDGITGDIRRITRGANKDVETIIGDIKAITGGIREFVGKSDKEVKDTADKLKGSLDKLSTAIDKLDGALGNVQDITEDVKDGKGAVGKLLKDEEVASNVKGIANNVEGITRDAGSFIKSLTTLQTFVGLRSEFNFQANTIKTYVSVEIRPRPDKYYLIELIDDPRGSRHVTQTIRRSDDPSKPLLTREEQITITDAFRFTFQFAKRISLATFRFGIKETTGGVGVDLHFFKDRIRIESDLFDFHANAWPRYKVVAAWEFWKRLYIIGGVDDALNARPQEGGSGGRDYILGAQVRFNDEDLRSLLMVGGSALGAAAGK
jgi:phospholipid/cholesterol/gamma-HCH transport system substrate-binding protein